MTGNTSWVVYALPNNELAMERFRRRENAQNLARIHPTLRDKKIQEVVHLLLDPTPKTTEDIALLLLDVKKKLGEVLKVIENERVIEALGIRPTIISKIEFLSASKDFDKVIIDRDVPSTFLFTMRDQKLRAKAYSLWRGLESYGNIISQDIYSPYMIHCLHIAFSLHKLWISYKEISNTTPLIINGKSYVWEFDSFLMMAKSYHDVIWEEIKKHSIKTNSDINEVLREVNCAWNDGQKWIIQRSENVTHVNFRK